MIYDRSERGRRSRCGCGCGSVTVECAPAPAPSYCVEPYGQTAGVVNGNPLEAIQCEPIVTYETVVEPTVYYTLADVENTHYVKHIVPVVYQQTIKNVTQHEYVMEQTLDQAQEDVAVGFEQNVAGLVSTPCVPGAGNGPAATGASVAGAYGSNGCIPGCNVSVQCR